MVTFLLETTPRHQPSISSFFFFGGGGGLLIVLSLFQIFPKIATYCLSLSPFNKQIGSFSIVWQQQRTLGIRDLHKTFQIMTRQSTILQMFVFCLQNPFSVCFLVSHSCHEPNLRWAKSHPAAKGVRQKEFGKKVTKKVTEASERVTKK